MRTPPPPIQEVAGGTRLRLKILPRAPRTEVSGIHGNLLRIRVASAPVDGAANHELTRFLAERLALPHSAVQLVSGQTSRTKVVMVRDVSLEQVRSRLGL